MKRYILLIPILAMLLSCYKDKGNYEYSEINKVTITGIEETINCDQMDLLYIPITLAGTIYSDSTLFDYEWEVNNKVIARTKDLTFNANFPIGEQLGRFIVTDKKLKTKTFFQFKINIASATAGDGILVLSKYQGQAELSFKRLDKAGSVFSPNFYNLIAGTSLGANPVKIHRNYAPEGNNANSGLKIEVDHKLRSLSEQTLIEIGPNKVLDHQFFTGRSIVYPPEINGFDVTAAWHVYVTNAPFSGQKGDKAHLFVIANGELFSDVYTAIPAFNAYLTLANLRRKSPLGGKLAPGVFFSSFQLDGLQAYKAPGLIYLFDETHGQFLHGPIDGDLISRCPELGEYPGYTMVYGTHTATKYYSLVVLRNGQQTKMVYLRLPATKAEVATIPFTLIKSTNVAADVIGSETAYYPMRTEPYLYFTNNDKLYYFNIRSLEDGIAPSASNEVANLAGFGYSSDAKITCMSVSRTENEIILGVSRYGGDQQGMGVELKGDVLVVDQKTRKLIKKYEGVSGVPVDVIIKYQHYLREGKQNGTVVSDVLNF